jgi:hypothetical protein
MGCGQVFQLLAVFIGDLMVFRRHVKEIARH